MPNTTNFNWVTPADTDLVKDGAAAIRTLGNNIDASLVDLKGGTTGQVLAKASNADLDYTWSNVDPLTILDAKGDLISATAADTPARLASSGVNGDVLTVDTSTATGLKWAAPASGGMTLISTTTLSTATTSLTSIPTTYVDLVLIIRDFFASSATRLDIQVNGQTANYYGYNAYNFSNATGIGAESGSTTAFRITAAGTIASADNNNSAYVIFYDYASSFRKTGYGLSNFVSSGGSNIEQAFYRLPTEAAITSIDIKTNAGTWSNGTALLYGVK